MEVAQALAELSELSSQVKQAVVLGAGGAILGSTGGDGDAAEGLARSARWADDPVARLLAELGGVVDRRARYVCELVVLSPGGEELHVRGTLDGDVALEARGHEGFGYDPILVPLGEERTVAELGDAWKAEHSHRAQAARALAARLTAQR